MNNCSCIKDKKSLQKAHFRQLIETVNRKVFSVKFNVMSAVVGVCAGSRIAFAAGDYGIGNIFSVGGGLVEAIQNGLTNIVAPLAIVSVIYCAVRMLLSKDPKNIAEYKKHLIEALVVTVIAFAAPGLINVMKQIGGSVGSGLG